MVVKGLFPGQEDIGHVLLTLPASEGRWTVRAGLGKPAWEKRESAALPQEALHCASSPAVDGYPTSLVAQAHLTNAAALSPAPGGGPGAAHGGPLARSGHVAVLPCQVSPCPLDPSRPRPSGQLRENPETPKGQSQSLLLSRSPAGGGPWTSLATPVSHRTGAPRMLGCSSMQHDEPVCPPSSPAPMHTLFWKR